MTTKFLLASLLGTGVVGGLATGGYYLFKPKSITNNSEPPVPPEEDAKLIREPS